MNLMESSVNEPETIIPDVVNSPTLRPLSRSLDLERTTDHHFDFTESSPTKRSNKNCRPKRKNACGTKQSKKSLKGRASVCSEDGQEGRANVVSRNAESEEGEDSTHSSSIPPTRADSSLGSSILEEVLSEKKKALLESTEMIEFLRSHMKPL